MKPPRLVEGDGEHRPGVDRRLVGAELGAPGTSAGFDAQGVERVVAGVGKAGAGEAEAVARRVQGEVDVARHLDRHVELEAGAADVAHARRADARMTDVDLRRVRELQPLGRQRFCAARTTGAARSSRAFGPIKESTAIMPLTSASTAFSSARVCRAIQSASRVGWAEPVTSRKLCAASRVIVRSLSKPPRSFSIAV